MLLGLKILIAESLTFRVVSITLSYFQFQSVSSVNHFLNFQSSVLPLRIVTTGISWLSNVSWSWATKQKIAQLRARKVKLSMKLGSSRSTFGKIRHGAVTVGPFWTVRVPSRLHGCCCPDNTALSSPGLYALRLHRSQAPFPGGGDQNRFVLPVRSCLMLAPKRLANVDGTRGRYTPLDSSGHA